jgi:hypothetical protein
VRESRRFGSEDFSFEDDLWSFLWSFMVILWSSAGRLAVGCGRFVGLWLFIGRSPVVYVRWWLF